MSPLVWLGDLVLSPLGLVVWLGVVVLGYLELAHRRDRRRKIAWLRTHGDNVVELAPAASQLRRPRVPPAPRRERRPG